MCSNSLDVYIESILSLFSVRTLTHISFSNDSVFEPVHKNSVLIAYLEQ